MSSSFVYFLITVLIVNISPGPAMMFVLQQAQKRGVKAGIIAALGLEAGVFIYVVFSALGLSTIFKEHPNIYMGLQLLGAAYLLYIAYLSWPRSQVAGALHVASVKSKNTFFKGVFINLTNPKIALFFVSLVPQFVPHNSGIITFILYGLLFDVCGIVVNCSVAFLANKMNLMLHRASWFDYIPPLLFIMIAVFSIVARFL